MRRFLLSLAALLAVGAILYSFGLRVVLYGGLMPHLRFVKSKTAQAEEIARNRARLRESLAPLAASPGQARPPSPSAPSFRETSPTLTTRNPQPAYWTDFRGPLRDGHYRETPILTTWPAEGLKPLWKQPVGGGYASFVVARGRAFTIEQRGHDEVVAAYDARTGREIWKVSWTGEFREFMGGDGPRATPTWSDGLVFALGALGELRCLDEETGRVVWRTNILTDNGAENLTWGMAAAPLVIDNAVIVLPGGPNGHSVAAYNRQTGARIWTALSDRQAYSSPMLETIAGVRQLIVVSASRVMGLTIDRGSVLWEYPWTTQYDVNAAQPLMLGNNRIFVSSGYGTGAAVIELTPRGDGFDVREVWRNIRMKNKFTSSVLSDGFVYGLDNDILACIDPATGDLKWKGGRYGYGQILLADGHLIVLTEDGELALVRASPDAHHELARFSVLDGKTWNHPALAEGILLVRNETQMAAIDLRVR